jgi:polar amino acid transport system ATP-binding protein
MIRLENVRKRFGETEVLRGINLEVQRGQRLVVIGPSGSGKSTLLRVINHLEPIDDGLIYLHGKPVFGRTADGHLMKVHDAEVRAVREKTGMVSQRFNLFPHMSVIDNIMVGPVKVKKVPPAEAFERAKSLLARVGLEQKTFAFPSELSGGQQQRVAIARSLAMDPDAILFDEVTSALDPELVGEVLSVMRDLASQGTTMVIVTHEMKFGRDVADRVIMMDHGQIVEEAAPDQLFTNPQSDRTRAFLRDILDR